MTNETLKTMLDETTGQLDLIGKQLDRLLKDSIQTVNTIKHCIEMAEESGYNLGIDLHKDCSADSDVAKQCEDLDD